MLGQIQYVGTLKEILQLDYGPMASPIVLFCCNWVKNGNNNKHQYKQDDARFLLANVCHILHMSLMNHFFFLAQVQQVFFWNEPKTPWWKVVLGREPKSL